MLVMSAQSFADRESTVINNYYTTEEYITEEYITESTSSTTINNSITGIALSIATSQHQFDFGTSEDVWQGSVGVGNYKGKTATSFALGKRVGRMLVNGSVGKEEGSDLSFGAGINWRF